MEAGAAFLAELRDSGLARDRDLVPRTPWRDGPTPSGCWRPCCRTSPAVIVLDELPWRAEQDELFDGALQTAWDRLLSRRPVLLLLLGSDLHMMERLTAYDRPFYGRADNLLLGPLNPAEVGAALGLEAADAIDAHLMSGGLPRILRAWPAGTTALAFAEGECEDPASPLFGVPETALLAEFPGPDMTRRVIEAIGGGDRTYATSCGGRKPGGHHPAARCPRPAPADRGKARAGRRRAAVGTGREANAVPGRRQRPEVLPGDRASRTGMEQAGSARAGEDAAAPEMDVMARAGGRTGDSRGLVAFGE